MITNKETEIVIKNLPKTKSLEPYGITGECYQTFKDYLMHTPFKKKARKRNASKLIYKANITVIAKKDRIKTKKKIIG